MHFLIVYLVEVVEDAVSRLRHFAGIIASLDFQEAAEPLPSLAIAGRRAARLQRRPGIGIKGVLIGICGIGIDERIIRSAFRRIPEADDAIDDAFQHHGAIAETGQLVDGQQWSGIVPVVIDPVIIDFPARLLYLLSDTSEPHLHHELESQPSIALILAVASYASGAQVPAPSGR